MGPVLLALALASFVGLPTVEAEKKKFKAGIEASLVSEYNDNLYHLSDEELAEFDERQAQGEQFFEMEEPEDIVTRIRLVSDLSWRIAKKREVGLLIQASYYAHARNTISDYPRLDIQLSYDVTKKDQLYAGADLIFDRFWKNYKVANTTAFAPAIYDQTLGRFGYVRDINKHWNFGLEYRRQDRTYDPPLQSRNREGNYLAAYTFYDIAKKAEGRTTAHYGDLQTPTEIDFGIPEDRSYTEWLLQQDFAFGLGKTTELDLTLQYRQREATTPFEADLARFDRVDRRYRMKVVLATELTKRLLFRIHAGHTRNDSDRIDPSIITDEVGYDETVAGIGLRYSF